MSFADKCPHCEHDKCCFCGKEENGNEAENTVEV